MALVQYLVPFESVCVLDNPCSSSRHRAPGKKAAVPLCKVLLRPGEESNYRPTSIKGTHCMGLKPGHGLIASEGPTTLCYALREVTQELEKAIVEQSIPSKAYLLQQRR